MLKISDALRADIKPYVEYRFGHKSKTKRHGIVNKIMIILRSEGVERIRKFHADIMRFMDTNREGIEALRKRNRNAVKGHKVENIELILQEDPKAIKSLIRKHNGDMDEVMKEYLDGGND